MKFNPLCLTIARKRRMLNKKGLAELVGVSSHTITRCETGTHSPTPENVRAFAEALRFPYSFFYIENANEPDRSIVSFRSQTSMTAAIRDASLAAGSICFLIADWVEKLFELPRVSVPDLQGMSGMDAANALRQEWNLGERPISNMIHLLESFGVRIFTLAENTEKVNAYSLWKLGTPYIFLNTIKSAECSRFDAAHELGHLVMHQDGKLTGREAEDQANQFASAFLMPTADVLAAASRSIYSIEQLIRLKARWKVSLAALNYRLHRVGLITDWKYRDFCIEIARRGFHKQEPLGITRETSVVWQKVLHSLWSDGKTLRDVAADIFVPEAEISEYLFGLIGSNQSEAVKEEIRPLSVLG